MADRISVGKRVWARRGPLEAVQHGFQRAQRAFKPGVVQSATAHLKWLVEWDDGTRSEESSRSLKLEPKPSAPRSVPPFTQIVSGTEAASCRGPNNVGNGSNEFGPAPPSTGGSQGQIPSASTGAAALAGSVLPSPAIATPASGAPSSVATTPPSSIVSMTTSEEDEDDDEEPDPQEAEVFEVGSDEYHEAKRAASAAACAALVGTNVKIISSDKKSEISWTVVDQSNASTFEERAANFENVGFKGGIPKHHNDMDLMQLFFDLYPGDMQADLRQMNRYAVEVEKIKHFKEVSQKEFLVFYGLIIGAAQFSQKGRRLWKHGQRRGIAGTPNFDDYMSHWRFKQIKSLVVWAAADLEKKEEDPWFVIRKIVNNFNQVRKDKIDTGLIKLLDESMSSLRPRQTPTGGLPYLSFILRKPKPLGTEFKVLCDASTGVFLVIEIQEGKLPMREKPLSAELGGCAGCSLRLAGAGCAPGSTLLGDSWFGSVKTAEACAKKDIEFIGVVKTAHSLFPKKWLEASLKDKSAGSRLVLTGTTHDGHPLVATGYKYNKRKVLCFISTAGAGNTSNGNPYIQRWPDEHGNLHMREVPRPALISEYFGYSPRIDNHNQSRQHDLALEEKWDTQCGWFRIWTTLLGMMVTDMWKLVKFHAPQHHRFHNCTIIEFADELSYVLLNNNLPNNTGASGPARRPILPISDATGDVNNMLGPENGHGHTLVQLEKKEGNMTKTQARCRYCACIHKKESWTTFFCLECDIEVCIPGKHGRTCWNDHIGASVDQMYQMQNRRASAKRRRTAAALAF